MAVCFQKRESQLGSDVAAAGRVSATRHKRPRSWSDARARSTRLDPRDLAARGRPRPGASRGAHVPRAPRAVRGFLAGVLSPILRAAATEASPWPGVRSVAAARADAGDASRTSCPRPPCARPRRPRSTARPPALAAQARGCQRAREAPSRSTAGVEEQARLGDAPDAPALKAATAAKAAAPRDPLSPPSAAKSEKRAREEVEDDAHARARRPAPAPAHAQAPTPAPAQAPTPAPAAPRLDLSREFAAAPRPASAPRLSTSAAPPPPRRRRR